MTACQKIMWHHILLLLFMPLLGLVGALVAPSAPQLSGQGFSLAVSQKNGASRDFVRDWAAVRHKWGSGVSQEVSSMFSLANKDGKVDVEPIGSDDIYIANVEIGTPPQPLKIALDTGSADLWIQSTDTMYRVNQKGPWAPQYKPNASETAHLVDDAVWAVGYLDGTSARGIVYRDTVRMGSFTIENATVQSAEMVATRFERETSLSGIMGLAKRLPSNIEPPTPSFLSLLKEKFDHPVFTVDLKRNASGRFDFGYVNESLATEKLTWVDSDPNSPHWDIEFNLTTWGETTPWYLHEFMATIDTGTTLMFLPDILASMYWFAVPGMRVERRLDNAYTFPCEVAKDLPDLMFKVPASEHVLTIPGPYLNYGPMESDPSYCWGGMQSAGGLDVTVLGDIMLKALFVGFDLEKNRVGFANKVLHDMK